MLPIRTILHPTDFSERSHAAFQLACALARDYSARLIVLYVAPSRAYPSGRGIVPREPEEDQPAIRHKLWQLRPESPAIRVEHRLAEGDATTEIVKQAQEIQSDLIVMGTHGWTGIDRLLMGSVAEGVMRKAPCPVLTLKTMFPPLGAGGDPAPQTASVSNAETPARRP